MKKFLTILSTLVFLNTIIPTMAAEYNSNPYTSNPPGLNTSATNATAGALSAIGNKAGTNFLIGTPITEQGSSVSALFIGPGAGAAFPINTPDPNSAIGIGSGALGSLTATGTEDTALGTWAAQYVTTATGVTAVGMHAFGYDNVAGTSAFGNDAIRDAVNTGGGYVAAIGNHAGAHGQHGGGLVAVGSQAMRGASSVVVLGGSLTNGDVISIALSTVTSGITGLPLTVSHTVAGGDTFLSVATDLATKIGVGIIGPSYFVIATPGSLPNGSSYVNLAFPGTITLGWAITTTPSVTGAATETAVASSTSVVRSVAIGQNAMRGDAMGTVTDDVFIGDGTATNITTMSQSALVGASSGSNATFALRITALGYNTCTNLQTGADDICVGANAAVAASGTSDAVVVGSSANGAGQSVSIGTAAGFATTTSNGAFTGVGFNAGKFVSSGTGNSAFGQAAMQGVSGTRLTGNDNTAIGRSAGGNLQGAAANNSLFGAAVGSTTLGTGTNNLLLGTNSSCDTSTGSTSNTIGLCAGGAAVFSVIAAGTPSASASTIAGTLNTVGGYIANGSVGLTASGASACVIKAIVGGIVTSATCT